MNDQDATSNDLGLDPPQGWSYAKPLQFLTITQLVDFARCPRLGFFRVICQLAEPVPHPALTFGSALGNGLSEMFTGDPTDRVQRAIAKFNLVWGDNDSLGDEKRNTYNAIKIIQSYAMQKGIGAGLYELVAPPPSLLSNGVNISPYEVPFAMLIGDLPIPIIGSIDGLVRDTLTGKLYCLERKTTSEWYLATLADNFRRNPQSMGYPYFARKLGLDIAGTIMEFVNVPPPGKTARANPKYEAITVPIPTLPHHDAEFERWLLRTAHEVLYRLEKRDFPTNMAACAPYSYFGRAGFPCRFSQLCDLPDWTILANTFVQRRHEPFDLTNLTVEGKEVCHAG